MKPNRKFLRQCVVCRSYKTKDELIRITKDFNTDEFVININNKIQGRSIYICKNNECKQKFLKNKKNLNSIKNILSLELC